MAISQLASVRATIIDFNLKLNSHYQRTVKQIVSHCNLDSSDRILDIGGGTGKIGNGIIQLTGAQVIVVEPDELMIKVGWRKNCQVDFVKAVGENLPFGDGEFSLILLVDVLHHTKNFQKVIEEVSRVLRTGGEVFIKELSFTSSPWRRFSRYVESIICGGLTTITPDKLASALEENNILLEFTSRGSNDILFLGRKADDTFNYG
jgi:ubiquinone/menaquinone biosynthesis C-methylase UbiE